MILKGSKRGGAADLARHLLKPENEHVEVHELRGFVSETLAGALSEAHAVSLGTRCQKFLFSLSLSPPELEKVPVSDFEAAIEQVEQRLGLVGQPRAIVFHEKEGRRHAHCVWSRIKLETMTAIDLPYFKRKLMDLSRDLYLEHDWRMPPGMIDPAMRSPLSFDMGEWFKAKRSGQNPQDIKRVFSQCWKASDSSKALQASLEQCGYFIAKGDTRAVVAIDFRGEIYNLSRWLGIRSKELSSKLDTGGLPSLQEARMKVADLVSGKLQGFLSEATSDFRTAAQGTEARRVAMVDRHRIARRSLLMQHEQREASEHKERSERFRKGLRGIWDRVTGAHRKVRIQNETELLAAQFRDRGEREELMQSQLAERQVLQMEIQHSRRLHVYRITRVLREQDSADRVRTPARQSSGAKERRSRSFDM